MSYRFWRTVINPYKPAPRLHRQIGGQPLVDSRQFKVMQYNVLADCYTDLEHGGNLNREHLNFRERFSKIAEELRESNADILTLCEIDHFDEYQQLLKELGYQMYTENRRNYDKLLIAFKPDLFEYVEHYGVQHDELTASFGPAKNSTANDF